MSKILKPKFVKVKLTGCDSPCLHSTNFFLHNLPRYNETFDNTSLFRWLPFTTIIMLNKLLVLTCLILINWSSCAAKCTLNSIGGGAPNAPDILHLKGTMWHINHKIPQALFLVAIKTQVSKTKACAGIINTVQRSMKA